MVREKSAAWHAEHMYFSRLLDLLQREVEDIRRDRHPNYSVMHDVVEYLHEYGARYHHPREDAAFALLARQLPELGPLIHRLKHEHLVIGLIGERLQRCLADMVEGFAASAEEIEAVATTYLLFYREHIAAEEQRVLRAASILSDEDWNTVAEAVPPAFDPLFGARPQERYRELLRQLTL